MFSKISLESVNGCRYPTEEFRNVVLERQVSSVADRINHEMFFFQVGVGKENGDIYAMRGKS